MKELQKVCERGDVARATNLLQLYPEVLDGPDLDTKFPYPTTMLWSPVYVAAHYGHEPLVKLLLDMGANPVPHEVSGQYVQETYFNWTKAHVEKGYDGIVRMILAGVEARYGKLFDEGDLHRAVVDGDIDHVKALIAEKPDRVKQVDQVGNTALHHAVAHNRLDIVRVLVEAGAPVDAHNGRGRTPSVVALFGLWYGQRTDMKSEILQFLLAQGAEYKMIVVATVGDEERVRELLKTDPSSASNADPTHRCPISGAVAMQHTNIVRMLLEHGADPNAKEACCQGGHSLRTAAQDGNVEIVQLLLDYGANPKHYVDSAGDAVYAAQNWGHTKILQKLYAAGATMEFQVYSMNHRIDVIAEILKLKPELADETLPVGWEDNGNEELALDIMKLAIRYGARFEKTWEWKLRWTVTKYPNVFKLLMEHGADPNQPLLGISGDQARRYAGQDDQLRHIRFLIEECGADVNCRDAEGLSPLAKAARQGYGVVADYLLSKGATVKTGGPEWAQPITLAENNGHAELAIRLRQVVSA
ncbi:MAG: ankyrin repeat domain-containing protein [Candidatus Poribacteria bacterium]|nr:ankyrin repeat domain-containing protein [Candidatus Poribacteria bacterium]